MGFVFRQQGIPERAPIETTADREHAARTRAYRGETSIWAAAGPAAHLPGSEVLKVGQQVDLVVFALDAFGPDTVAAALSAEERMRLSGVTVLCGAVDDTVARSRVQGVVAGIGVLYAAQLGEAPHRVAFVRQHWDTGFPAVTVDLLGQLYDAQGVVIDLDGIRRADR